MNVIGIIQTDLNEFSVLFEQGQGGQQGGQQGQGKQSQKNGGQGQQDRQDSQDSDSMFLSFLDEQPSSQESSSGGGGQQQQQQNGPQEMTVRIKGIPEGQKANFLQMYQILQDAQDPQSLQQSLTIVSQGDQQDGHGQHQGGNGQDQGNGSNRQNKTTH
ncbi:hypothetical protein [Brevibacillus brevis]|uniref:Uncharacterized protein n=1 Tax=Brevibacillus brevis TaxID=1393 RepID=A0ABY9T178_BREBE|nr:hypothetical protein [Brevibacillus brevis]WNC12717.1 hypothetical protein RGB73_18515 [Brevibacillus brevis]